MKNILKNLVAVILLVTFNTSLQASGFGIGATISSNSLDTAGKEIGQGTSGDNSGAADPGATKNVTDDFAVGSIFAEYTATEIKGSKLALTVGVDYIPFDADIDKRSITQEHIEGSTDGAKASGTNSVEGTVEDHYTVYLQPGFMVNPNTILYGTIGYAQATVIGKTKSLTHTNINKSQDLDGVTTGAGIKHLRDSGIFVKFDYKNTDYERVSFTTSNGTQANAKLDNEAFAFSIGKQF